MQAPAAHSTELIATVAVSLSAAFVAGLLARRIGLSPIVGYMAAGIAVGPFTPGFVADQQLASQLAELGIALLMFGVGLHFSLRDLLAVRRIAVPGAMVQSAVATLGGLGVALLFGWGVGAGIVFGLALSVASTVVLVRGLTDQHALETSAGHVAVGWLVVEDLFTVLLLVLLPALAGSAHGLPASLGLTALKVLGLAVLYLVGVRVVPWLLVHVARLQSRELFTLAVLAIALGVAYGASAAFSVSMALGAFLGGMVVGQSDLSHQAAADALPLRDAFAVLFFVAVGMLFDPRFLVAQPGLVLATLAVVVLCKPLVALLIALWLGHPVRTGLLVGAGLGQIGEFSFIVGALGLELGLLPTDARQAIVAAAMFSIAANPLLFAAVRPLERWLSARPRLRRWLAQRPGELAKPAAALAALRDHAVLCGHGRVGSVLARVLTGRGLPLLVIEQDRAVVQQLRHAGVMALQGDAANEYVLAHAALPHARILLVTLPDPLAARQIVDCARRLNPRLPVVARTHTDAERDHLHRLGGVDAVHGELELAVEMARHCLQRFGLSQLEAQAVALDLRHGGGSNQGSAQVHEVEIGAATPADGRTLAELELGRGVLVFAITRRGELLVPDGQTRLEAGDRLLLVASRELLAQVHSRL